MGAPRAGPPSGLLQSHPEAPGGLHALREALVGRLFCSLKLHCAPRPLGSLGSLGHRAEPGPPGLCPRREAHTGDGLRPTVPGGCRSGRRRRDRRGGTWGCGNPGCCPLEPATRAPQPLWAPPGQDGLLRAGPPGRPCVGFPRSPAPHGSTPALGQGFPSLGRRRAWETSLLGALPPHGRPPRSESGPPPAAHKAQPSDHRDTHWTPRRGPGPGGCRRAVGPARLSPGRRALYLERRAGRRGPAGCWRHGPGLSPRCRCGTR